MSIAALQVARTGLDAQSERMRVIANNLANVNTTGFQRDRAEFATLAYQMMTAPGSRSSAENQYAVGLNVGTGVRMTGTGRVTTPGHDPDLGQSARPRDRGRRLFPHRPARRHAPAIPAPAISTCPTRARSSPATACRCSRRSRSRTAPSRSRSAATAPSRRLCRARPKRPQVGQIEISRFINPAGLQAVGNNLYLETAASGSAQTGAAGAEGRGSIRQGALEGSNVNVVQELVDMIETQRAYEVNSKMISATDEMLRNANQQL